MQKSKKIKKSLKIGMLISAMALIMPFTKAHASPLMSANQKQTTDYANSAYVGDRFDLKQYIQSLDFLSDDEKQQLLRTYEKTKPLYEKIDGIDNHIFEISDRILANSDHIYKEIDGIYENHSALWDRLFDSLTEEQEAATNDKERIKASAVLNAEEKAILLSEQERLDTAYSKLNRAFEQLEQETSPFYAEIDALYRQIDALDQADKTLWKKINLNDHTAIPY